MNRSDLKRFTQAAARTRQKLQNALLWLNVLLIVTSLSFSVRPRVIRQNELPGAILNNFLPHGQLKLFPMENCGLNIKLEANSGLSGSMSLNGSMENRNGMAEY